MSELKSITGSANLPQGALANGAEGIKEAIQGFDDARKSDIENERLPPDIIDPDEDKPASPSPSVPTSPAAHTGSPIADKTGAALPPLNTNISASDIASPVSPATPGGASWRRGHARQASLGTTRTSPSTRRRSLENTMELIRDVVGGRDANADSNVRELAEVISSPSRTRPENSIA